ncbi:hypothetical protein [Micromonospora inyonensis]|uniref:DUF3040 domain-containing protein n=1 Tax=Micromonospora inyonensis TaxID=47866 RepID=A0A1C6RT56_9ACTN|nr:hypothetical protein [Micromonospora inyonensis]SCL20374.1 hypothetical protein GA0074694_3016 [Micromonospora inyonensis]
MTEDRATAGGDRGKTRGHTPVRVLLRDAVDSLLGRRRVVEGTRTATEELLANVGYQLRTARAIRTIIWTRVIAVLVLVALVPLARQMPAIGALGMLAAVSFALIVVEVIMADGQRSHLRESGLATRVRT